MLEEECTTKSSIALQMHQKEEEEIELSPEILHEMHSRHERWKNIFRYIVDFI